MVFLSWVIFGLIIIFLLILDLGVIHRKSHKMSSADAIWTSLFWIGVSLCFNLWVYWVKGADSGFQFLTGYLIEKALSIDNLFVFILIFSYFKTPEEQRYKVLFWGILGAIILRGVFIALGVVMIERFDWLLYFFGAFLIFTAYKLAIEQSKKIHPEKNPLFKLLERFIPITHKVHDGKFFVRLGGALHATPMLLALISVETTDVIFALDSIPAIFGVTTDPFIIYTSNIFAILGLRALYFALANLMDLFHHLHYGLAAILFFVGTKMLLKDFLHFPILVSLGLIALLLAFSMIASLIWSKVEKKNDSEKSP
ncbi:hypothetical protein PHSC3_000178 [Chlamydiales bacterium STE3]|nr:hypothetical protein PHSC3_000178 [Chlamydiales bacterium STE3]